MYNHDEKGKNSMMWMMLICGALILGVLFLGGSSLSSGGYFWPILVGVFVVAHIWMMFGKRGSHDNTTTKNKIDDNKHKHGGCCH